CVCGKKIGPDPRNFNQRVSLGRNDLLIRTFLSVAILLPWNHPENQILNYYNPVNRVYWYVTIGALSAIPEASRYF
ncbi:hypothetical protein V9Y69_16900, partial [Klebsiella pneumoniae]